MCTIWSTQSSFEPRTRNRKCLTPKLITLRPQTETCLFFSLAYSSEICVFISFGPFVFLFLFFVPNMRLYILKLYTVEGLPISSPRPFQNLISILLIWFFGAKTATRFVQAGGLHLSAPLPVSLWRIGLIQHSNTDWKGGD